MQQAVENLNRQTAQLWDNHSKASSLSVSRLQKGHTIAPWEAEGLEVFCFPDPVRVLSADCLAWGSAESRKASGAALNKETLFLTWKRIKRMSGATGVLCSLSEGPSPSGRIYTGGQRQGAVSSGKPLMLRVPTTSQPNGHSVGSGGNKPSLTSTVGLGRILSHKA